MDDDLKSSDDVVELGTEEGLEDDDLLGGKELVPGDADNSLPEEELGGDDEEDGK